MFKKILISNRGDRHRNAVLAAQPECVARAACAGDFIAGGGGV
jgi:hypothetical protein